jgi:uncharacterized protein YfaS (alpha-2-macroglobulin family)
MRLIAPLSLALVLWSVCSAVSAAEVTAFSPQGSIRDVRQVTATFDTAVVPFGDPRLPDPFTVQCAAAGSGRWADARHWVYDFEQDLPAGLRCSFTVDPAFRDLSGAALTGKTRFGFDTGGPAIRASMPSGGSTGIDEEQLFVLALDAPATTASVEAHGYCAVENLAERLPLKVVDGADREAVLAQRRLLGYSYYRILWKDGDIRYAQLSHDQLAEGERDLVVVRCARPLPTATKVELVWGSGIAAQTDSGVTTVRDQSLRFVTRPAFTARFSCDRVNASAACIPVLPMRVEFSSPVPRETALAIRLKGPGGTREPKIDEGENGSAPTVDQLEFPGPFPERSDWQLELPAGLVDDAGRSLANASSFPLKVSTDGAPPLAKFSAEFGILEAEEGGVLPVTLRGLEDEVPAAEIGGAQLTLQNEADVLRWMQQVRARMSGQWQDDTYVQPGVRSVFEGETDITPRAFKLSKPNGGSAFEVVGIPLGNKGFHVVELASPRLGAALLGKPQPRYVATTALVTNMAVHFKWGRERSLAFVTTLDGGKPVAGAQLRVIERCHGTTLWQGNTDDQGTAFIDGLPRPRGWSSCSSGSESQPLMVSARSGDDFSFTFSDWDEGIQPWSFKLDTGTWDSPLIGHTVLDRALFRAGETVSMKHYWREQSSLGLTVPSAAPKALVVEHDSSGQEYRLPLNFDANGIAESQWPIPKEAKLGRYSMRFEGAARSAYTGEFRVEEYRVPLMRALVTPPKEPAVAVHELPLDLYVGYFSGGGAAGLPVKLRTQVEPRSVSFKGYEAFRFNAQAVREGIRELSGGGYFPDEDSEGEDAAPVAQPGQTLPLSLDAQGNARVSVPQLPESANAQTLVTELEYPDANGEVSSLRAQIPLWPAAQVVGLSTDGWVATADAVKFTAVVLDLSGKPLVGKSVEVSAYELRTQSYRKRLVGGFYAYSHSEETRKLPAHCAGKTDEQGLLPCTLAPGISGQLLLEAVSRDRAGRAARATQSVWVAGKDDWWFAQGDSDRMDVVPEQREVQAGEKLRLQVRMPFRSATALVTVEREGVMERFVTTLSGKKPVVEVPIQGSYAPNVFVSVLAVRPRVSDFRARFYDYLRALKLDQLLGRWVTLDAARPTALTDLSKPAYRLGIAAVDVGWRAQRLKVELQTDTDRFPTRGQAQVRVRVQPEDGSALPASAEIAFSAVDEGLLDLLPNPSVNLLDAMMQRRGIDVFTSTAQTQVVGKRHYGRKAMAPGGGGGRGAAREMLDSLLLWKGRVPLDAQGNATVQVPLNDALTSFRLTAVASAGVDRFGTGTTSIRTTQDIQLLSGLPPVVREGDQLQAVVTVRNTTDSARTLKVHAKAQLEGVDAATLDLVQNVNVPANGSLPVHFALQAPLLPEGLSQQLNWIIEAQGSDEALLDALKVKQSVLVATPVRVQQATLAQLDGPLQLPAALPADAIVGRGSLRLHLDASLSGSLSTVRDWMRVYPYTCFEQIASIAIALGDETQWKAHMARLPAFQDSDGLVKYFASPYLQGSDTLTAYLLSVADTAGWEIPEAERKRMLAGLQRFLQGRLQRGSPLERNDQVARKMAAFSALARYDAADTSLLAGISIDPNLWPTSAVIDWLDALQHMDSLPNREAQRTEAMNVLRSRLNFQGTTMGFSTERDDALWWLMISPDLNANRMLLLAMNEPEWREDLPRLLRGTLGRQQAGHWNLTTANAWGALALQSFAAHFEKGSVGGTTVAQVGTAHAEYPWSAGPSGQLDLPWPAKPDTLSVQHEGSGAPWVIVQSRAAVPLREPFSSGYRIQRSITAVEQKQTGRWSVGDVAKIKLDVDAQSDMTWVVLEDPVPAGASILGSGLGRDSALLSQGAQAAGDAWLAYEERRFDSYRAYYRYIPKGSFSVEYTLRYNSEGHFEMPTTRVEAMYAPEMYGEVPNAAVDVAAP